MLSTRNSICPGAVLNACRPDRTAHRLRHDRSVVKVARRRAARSRQNHRNASFQTRFGRNLEYLREICRLDLARMCDRTGIGRQRFRFIESGKVNVTIGEFYRIAGVFGMPPAALLRFGQEFRLVGSAFFDEN